MKKKLSFILLMLSLALAAPVVGLAQSGTGCIVSGDTTVCIGDTLYGFTINDSVSSPMDSVYYRWLRNSDTVVVDSVVYTQDTLVVDGNYTFVRLSKHKDSADWHQDDGSFVITAAPLPAVEITGDSVICKGDSTTLKATPLDSCTYLWSDGARTDSIIVRSGGDFSVTVTDTNSSCKNTGTMRVTVNVPVDSAFTIDTCGNYTWHGTTYTVSGNYTNSHEDANGCTQVDTLHLTINHTTYGDTTAVACGSFDWYEHTGITQSCENLTHTFPNIAGCDSVVTLHLIVNTTEGTQVFDTICEGDMYPFFGQLLDSTGVYTDTLFSSKGCDSVVTLFLTVNPTYDSSITRIICQGDSVVFNGVTLKSSGVYVDTLQSSGNGCDSIVTLYLTVNPLPTAQIIPTAATICEGDSVTLTAVGGTTYIWSKDDMILDKTHTLIVKETGAYSVEVTDTNNCSAMANFTLTVNSLPNVSISDNTSICQGQTTTLAASGDGSYLWSNASTQTSISVSQSGTYTVTVTNMHNCSATASVTVTVNPLPIVTITGESSICKDDYATLTATGASTYRWNDGNTSSTKTVNSNSATTLTYFVTGTDNNSCSNTANKTVTVNPTYNITVYDTICDGESYNFFGQSIDYSVGTNTFIDTLHTTKGCDSVITLTLTVYPTYDVDTAATICQGDTFHFLDHHLTTAGNYTYVLQSVNGCDSVITLSLTVDPSYHRYITDTICQGNTFDFNGRSISTTGIYTDTLQTVKGCDSIVTLTLVVKPKHYSELTVTACDSYSWNDLTYTSTGDYVQTFTGSNNCDSIVTLHLTIIQSSTAVDSITACDSYTWINGVTYTTSNYNATYTLTNAAGCDSIVTLHLTVNYSDVGDTTAFACNSFDWYEHTHLTTTGEYTHIFENAAGCDSVVTLHLTVGHDNTGDTTAFVCDSFDWFEYTNITQSGDYTHTFTNASGCDSVVTLHLTIRNSNTGEIEAVACDSYDWYEHTNITTSGDYTHIFTNAAGCDSVVTLHLTVNHSAMGDTTAVECESFIWHGVEYTSTPTVAPKFTYQTVKGCDSVVTLHLTIYKPQHTDTTVVVCDEYFWNGATYTGSGTYTFSHADADGCIQVDTLHLTIYPSFILQLSETICQSELPYHYLNGEIDTTFETGTPQSSEVDFVLSTVNGCDSVISLSLTVVPSSLQQLSIVAKTHADGTPYMLIYPQAGLLYQWYRDGDAISGATGQYYVPEDDLQTSTACYRVLVRPDILHCGIMTDCWVKTDASAAKVCILPNPNDGRFRLLLPADAVSVRIFNANGQLVLAQETTGEIELNISADLANGLYMVQVQRENGEINTEKLVINR